MSKKDRTLISDGYVLPTDVNNELHDMSGYKYFRRQLQCQGLFGHIRAFYREGNFGSCERQKINLKTWAKVRLTNKTENKQALLDAAHEQIDKGHPKIAIDEDHPWVAATDPPKNFFLYQTTSPEDVPKILEEIMNSHREASAPIIEERKKIEAAKPRQQTIFGKLYNILAGKPQ